MNSSVPLLTDAEILAARPPRNAVDPHRPYACFVEPERTADGCVEDVATIFLTNRECPFRCLFCDLWKNTTEAATTPGAIVEQIDHALARLPPARHIKLYNSGNFFDAKAIPPSDHRAIADRISAFETVIVENHPLLCTEACLSFRDLIDGRLELALGLETVHPEILRSLNKRMRVEDFDRAARFLVEHGILVRAFILLRPPFLTEEEGVAWALRSVEHAFSVGVGCCVVIPVRPGNGILDRLQQAGQFAAPRLASLEAVLETGIRLQAGRVFADLWDVDRLHACTRCGPRRVDRLRRMNLEQTVLPPVECDCVARDD